MEPLPAVGSAGDGPADPRRLRRRAGITTLASAAALVVLWVLFIRTGIGQHLDDLVIRHRAGEPASVRAANDRALRLVSNASLGAGVVALVAVGVVRRRMLLGLAAAAAVGATTLSSEALKRWVIDRPGLSVGRYGIQDNSFPSGHAAISTALALAFLMVMPHRWRRVTAVGGALWVTLQATGVISAGWHRPSDALAGYALALGWASFAVWALARFDRVAPSSAEVATAERTSLWIVSTLAVAVVGLVCSVLLGGDTPYSIGGAHFVAASLVIDSAGVMVVWWYWRMLTDWALDVHPGPR